MGGYSGSVDIGLADCIDNRAGLITPLVARVEGRSEIVNQVGEGIGRGGDQRKSDVIVRPQVLQIV